MILRVDRIHYPVTTLGPGQRLGVWVQGCTLACPGCLSRDTWDPAGGSAMAIDELIAAVDRLCLTTPDGVTISGGEPFQQAPAVAELVDGLRAWGHARGRELDVLVYSGLAWDVLQHEHASLLQRVDAVIPEPFDATEAPTAPWRGSANQPLQLLTDLAHERFDGASGDLPGMQAAVHDGALWMVGVPRPGDLPRIEAGLRRRGVHLRDVSWRP